MKIFKVERQNFFGRSFKGVPVITDTAGFEPMDVKIKRFMLSGQIAQFSKSMFDSSDFKEMYSAIPDIVYDVEDDIEETRDKVRRLVQARNEIVARKLAALQQLEKPVVDDKQDVKTDDVKDNIQED